jgi:hypothetical protein
VLADLCANRACAAATPDVDADLAADIVRRFRETGRSVGEALNPLIAAARGHPQRAMLLAHRLWEEVEPNGVATIGDWSRGHATALAELQPEFDANWRRLSTNAQKALRAVVAGAGSPFQQRVLEQLELPKSTARAALKTLAANATIEQQGDGYVVVDPLFAEWIGRLPQTGEDTLEPETAGDDDSGAT